MRLYIKIYQVGSMTRWYMVSFISWRSFLTYFWRIKRIITSGHRYYIVQWKYFKSALHTFMCSNIKLVFCFLLMSLEYLLIHTFKNIYRAHWHICVQNCQWYLFATVKLLMMAFQSSQIAYTWRWYSFEISVSMNNVL